MCKECRSNTHITPNTHELDSQPNPRNMSLTLMSDQQCLDFTVSQDLAINQVQGDLSVENLSSPRHLGLVMTIHWHV